MSFLNVTRYPLLVLFLSPLIVFAKTINATVLLNRISTFVIDPIIYLLFAAAFVVFIWGLVQFVMKMDNEEARSTGVKHIIWGIIGMVIMVGVNAIIAIIDATIRSIGGA